LRLIVYRFKSKLSADDSRDQIAATSAGADTMSGMIDASTMWSHFPAHRTQLIDGAARSLAAPIGAVNVGWSHPPAEAMTVFSSTASSRRRAAHR
jgi:hypothetical protein